MSATEEGNAAGGGASLTREQLLEYIKKQKIQIKKLQNDAVKSNLNSSSNGITHLLLLLLFFTHPLTRTSYSIFSLTFSLVTILYSCLTFSLISRSS